MKELPKKIQRRMAALQAMAADSSSENEAMIAAQRLHVLLAEYGISEFSVEAEPEIDKMSFTIGHDKLGVWAGHIAMGIAELYFCTMYQMPTVGKGKNRTRRFFITGSSNYRTSAVLMCNAVIDAVYTQSKIASATDRPKGVDGWAFISSFRNTAGLRINQRCGELIAEARAGELVNEETGNTLPALADAYDVALTAANEFNIKLNLRTKSQKQTTSDPFGSTAGRKFGDEVGLRQGIAAESSMRLLA
jgi:hypothetical protein